MDAGDRPPPDRIRVSPERAAHILDGDPTGNGGGHRHGTGRPGKTEFPASWDDQKVLDAVLDVARRPDRPPVRQESEQPVACAGIREDVEIAVVSSCLTANVDGLAAEGGPGVVRIQKGRS